MSSTDTSFPDAERQELVRSKLANSGNIYRLLVDAVEDYAIFALDADGIILTWNLGGERLKGYLAHEVIGTHFSRFYTQPDLDRDHPAHELKLAAERGKYEEEGWRLRKNGETFWANVVITALRDENGVLQGFGKVTRDLTIKKNAEIALKDSEERFRLMVSNVTDYAIIMLDPQGFISSWNAGAQRIKGYRPQEIIGKHFSSFYPVSEIEGGRPEMELRIATDEGRYEEEGWRVRKDGTMFWANVTITALRDEASGSGSLRGFAKVTRDLTSRRQADEALRQSQERYRLLLDNVKDYALILLDARGRVTNWNTGATRITGYETKEILGSHFSKFYTPRDLAANKPGNELKIAAEQGRFEEEGIRIRKDGTEYWASVVLTTIRDDLGGIRGYSKVTRDLTEQRASEAKLRDSEERFRLMIESVADYAIFMLNPTGHIITWNKGAERNKGYSATEIIGQHFSVFYTAEDLEIDKPERELREAVKTGRFEDEGWRIKKDGTHFWASVVITPVYDKVNTLIGFAKVTRNLTERKQAEDELRAAYSDLEIRIEERTKELSAAKASAEAAVAARDQFFSIASHELKTPLSSLRLQSQIRKRCVAKGDFSDFAPDRLAELCEDDERQISRLAFLVDNMLDISKLTSGNFKIAPERLDLNELVADVVRRMDPFLKEVGNACAMSAPTKIFGMWDRHRIEQVLTNLLSNTAKYAPGKPVDVALNCDADAATIRVRDHGPGIAKAEHDRIFKPFERLRQDRGAEGLGLGLYIVQQIVEAHGGRLRLESEVGVGSTFIVELPFHPTNTTEAN